MKRSTVQSCLAAPFLLPTASGTSSSAHDTKHRGRCLAAPCPTASSRRGPCKRITSLDQGTTRYRRDGAIGHVVFDRPQARNAMTWAMYDELAAICRRVNDEPGLRAVTLRGAGGKAFIAGTDSAQLSEFRSGEDGLAYEEQCEA